jgi:hypothetical protein
LVNNKDGNTKCVPLFLSLEPDISNQKNHGSRYLD